MPKINKRYLLFFVIGFFLISQNILLTGCSVNQSEKEEEECIPEKNPVSTEDKLLVRYMNLLTEKKGGDAIIIQTPERETVMIDAGRTPAGSQVNQYLDKLGIKTIDYAIYTHPHIDHIGGYLTLVDTKQIDKFFLPNVEHSASYYKNLIKKLEEKQLDETYLEEGDKLLFDSEIQLEVFSPPKGTAPPNSTSIQTINDLSLVIKITFGETSFLFTGDINMNRERKLINSYGNELSADMLHAPHHGGNTSSSLNFIQTVDPSVVIISENKGNALKGNDNASEIVESHVYRRYENYGSKIYVTDRDGNITLTSDGEEIKVIGKSKRTEYENVCQ